MDTILLALGQQLRKLRLEAGLSQSDLASRAGVGIAAVERLEAAAGGGGGRRRVNPRIQTLCALAGALGVHVADLLECPPAGPQDPLAHLLRQVDTSARLRILRVVEAMVTNDRFRPRAAVER